MQTTLKTLLEINAEQVTVGAWLKQYAKQKKYKPFQTSEGEISPVKFAELLFDYAVNGNPVDDALSDYSADIAEIAATIQDCVSAPKSAATLKAERDAEKAKKEQEEEDRKAAEQEHQLAVITSFDESIDKGSAAAIDTTTQFFQGITNSFPETIKINQNGGVDLNNPTAEDIGKAIGTAVQLNSASEYSGNMLTFIIGELTNAAVAAGVFKTKKECADYIASKLEASQGKKLSVKTIENMARTAERIPSEKRNEKVPATVYHEIANVKQVKPNEGESDADFRKRKNKRDKEITKILDKVSSGEVKEVKEVKELINKLQKDSGLKDEAAYTLGDYQRLLVETTILMGIVKGDEIAFIDGDSSRTIDITKAEVKAARDSVIAKIVNIKGVDPKADISISSLLYGYIHQEPK